MKRQATMSSATIMLILALLGVASDALYETVSWKSPPILPAAEVYIENACGMNISLSQDLSFANGPALAVRSVQDIAGNNLGVNYVFQYSHPLVFAGFEFGDQSLKLINTPTMLCPIPPG